MKHRSSLVRLFKSLADDARLTVLVTLAGMNGGTANEIAVRLNVHPSRTRQRLHELKWGGIVEQRRDGQTMRWYVSDRLPLDLLSGVLREARATEPERVM